MEKISVGHFLYGRLHRPRPISARELACQPVIVPPSLTDGAHVSGPSSPKSSPAARSLALPPQFSPLRHPPITTPSSRGCLRVHLPL
jgi:hypothetical protein